jgi:hypothetical protein
MGWGSLAIPKKKILLKPFEIIIIIIIIIDIVALAKIMFRPQNFFTPKG